VIVLEPAESGNVNAYIPSHGCQGELLLLSQNGALKRVDSVLTRLPHGQRIAANVAWKSLRSAFSEDPMVLGPEAYDSLFSQLALAGVSGGATYDALVAETARMYDVELVSFDRRAARTYEVVGVKFVLLEPC